MKKIDEMGLSKSMLVYIFFGAASLAFFYYLSTIFSWMGGLVDVAKPVIYGISFAFVLNVLMCPIEKYIFEPLATKNKIIAKLKRPLSIIVTILVLLGILALVFLLVLPRFVESIISLLSYLPQYVADFTAAIERILALYGINNFKGLDTLNWQNIMSYAMDAISQITNAITNAVPRLLGITVNITAAIISIGFGFIFAIYMLAQKETLLKKTRSFMKSYMPNSVNEKVTYVSTITNETFKNFLGGQCLDSLCLGVITFIVLNIIQMPYALVIAVTIAVTNMIPIVGPIMGVVPCAFIILVISPIKAVILVITIILLQEFESKLIYPRIVGGRVGLDGLWVLMAVLIGGNLGGLLGIILGVPVFAVLGRIIGADMEKRIGPCDWVKKGAKASKKKDSSKSTDNI